MIIPTGGNLEKAGGGASVPWFIGLLFLFMGDDEEI